VDETFGADGLRRVIGSREAKQRADYARRIARTAPLKVRLQQLARIRTQEGYMAEMRPEWRGFLFIENHCPICAAATACLGGSDVSDDRRCVYRVTRATTSG
jgi:predicted ArsR family transcriptional regulator